MTILEIILLTSFFVPAAYSYVGTEDGIFELKLNFEQRKFWPAIVKR